MELDKDDFRRVIAATPLVSIDLVVRNAQGEVLLGLRRNRPAQGCWFVPGGRIRKDERLREALARIARVELGVEVIAGRLLGVYEHLYEDNALGIAGLGTHYVVIGYQCELAEAQLPRADAQHAELRWWPLPDLLASPAVHLNTKRYFQDDEPNGFRCPEA